MLDNVGFNLWADHYDESVLQSEQSNTYPFAAYGQVLNLIYQTIRTHPSAAVLDIGFGTAVLSKRLYDDGYSIFGIDFSSQMLELAQEKMPEAALFQHDFTLGLPESLCARKFDFIVSTYAIHHLSDEAKITFLTELLDHLTPGGKILLGDVAFATRDALEACRHTAGDAWDEDEYYPVLEQIKSAFPGAELTQLSFCSGVITISK